MNEIVIVGTLETDGWLDLMKRVYGTHGIAPTLNTMKGGGRCPKIVEKGMKIRRITPRECWRLMGFADEDFDQAKQVTSDSQLYKQAGNSIVVQVLEAIFSEMLPKGEEQKP